MVNLFYIFKIANLLWALAWATPLAPLRFETDCAKPRIYTGESVICSYFISARDEFLDVEVSKFPEYRGFWSENLSLRQGPIPLNQGLSQEGLNRGSIGAYLITSMVGRSQPTIEPMKIFVRLPGSSLSTGVTLSSEAPLLQILPLPPLPPGMEARFFYGAVGRFSAFMETREVPFQKDEPITLRISLAGEGNFAELNSLRIPLPDFVDVLSRRTTSQGNAQYINKTFEFSLTIHANEDFVVPTTPFIYFNPLVKQYEQLSLPPISFRSLPSTPIRPEDTLNDTSLPPLEANWTIYRPWYRSTYVLLIELCLLCTIIGLTFFRNWEKRTLEKNSTPEFQQKLKCEIAMHSLQMGNIENFLRLADEIAYEHLIGTLGLPPHTPRDRALRIARRHLAPQTLSQLENIFLSYQTLAYSHSKASPLKVTDIQSQLTSLTSTARAS